MKSRSRDVRSTRREVNAMKRGEPTPLFWDGGEPFMDGLIEEEAAFTLPNGTQFDPRAPWELPTPTKEN